MVLRYHIGAKRHEFINVPEVDIFLQEILTLCAKYNFSITTEDPFVGFVIAQFNEDSNAVLMRASIGSLPCTGK